MGAGFVGPYKAGAKWPAVSSRPMRQMAARHPGGAPRQLRHRQTHDNLAARRQYLAGKARSMPIFIKESCHEIQVF